MDGPLVKAKDGKIYSSSSSEDTNKFLYRHLFTHEPLENHKKCPIKDSLFDSIIW